MAGKAHLGWVKKYLTELLDQAAQALQEAELSPADGYSTANTHINCLQKSLVLLRAEGAAKLADELQKTIQYTAGHDAESTESLGQLLEGVVNLRDYLDYIHSRGYDQAMVLVPLINELRSRRGEALLHEGKLFFPNLERPLPQPSWSSTDKTFELSPDSTELRQQWQRALRDWLKAEADGEEQASQVASSTLSDAAQQLYHAGKSKDEKCVWLLTTMTMQAVAEGCKNPDVSLQRLLARLDIYLGQQQAGNGNNPDSGEQESADGISRGLLYFVASYDQPHAIFDQLKDHYDLHQLVDKDILNTARQSLRGRNRELESSVASAILEELQSIKDRIDHLQQQSKSAEPEALQKHQQSLSDELQRLSSSLLVLNEGGLAEQLTDIAGLIDGHIQQQQVMPQDQLLDLAGLLLDVEAQLASTRLNVDEARSTGLDASTYQVLNLAINNLDLAQQTLDTLLRNKEGETSTVMPERVLGEAAGALDLANRPQDAKVLRTGADYLHSIELRAEQQSADSQLPVFADMLAAMERFLISLRDGEANYQLEEATQSYAQQLAVVEEGDQQQDEAVIADEFEVETDTDIHSDELTTNDQDADELNIDVSGDLDRSSEDIAPEANDELSASATQPDTDSSDIQAQPDKTTDAEIEFGAYTLAEEDSVDEDTDDVLESMEFIEGDSSDDADIEAIASAGQQSDEDITADTGTEEVSDADSIEQLSVDESVDTEFLSEQSPEELPTDSDELALGEGTEQGGVDIDDSQPSDSKTDLPEQHQPWQTDDELRSIFLAEYDDVLEALNTEIPTYLASPESAPALTSIRRSFHTIKGSARMVDANHVSELGKSLECLLNRVIDGTLDHAHATQILLGVLSALQRQRRWLQQGFDATDEVEQQLLAECEAAEQTAQAAINEPQVTDEQPVEYLSTDDASEQTDTTGALTDLTDSQTEAEASQVDPLVTQVTDQIPVIEDLSEQVDSVDSAGAEQQSDSDIDWVESNNLDSESIADDELEGAVVADAAEPGETEESIDPQLLGLIREELYKHDQTLSDYLAIYARQSWAPIPNDELIRAIHTLAGTLSLAPINDEAEAVHQVESYLTELRDLERAPDVIGMRLLAAVHELLDRRLTLLDQHSDDVELDTSIIHQLTQQVNDVLLQQDRSDSIHYGPIDLETSLQDPFAETEADENDAADEEAEATEQSAAEADTDTVEGDIDQAEQSTDDSLLSSDAEENQQPTEALDTDESLDDQGAEETADESAANTEDESVEAEPDQQHSPDDEHSDSRETDLDETDFDENEISEYHPAIPESISVDYESLDGSLIDVFLEEASEVMLRVDDCMQRWIRQGDYQVAAEVRRSLHTLKGGARMAGLDPIGELSHELETLLESSAADKADMHHLRVLQGGFDDLHDMLAAAGQRQALPKTQQSELVALGEQLQDDSDTDEQAKQQAERLRQTAAGEEATSGSRETLRVDAQVVDHLTNMAGEVSIFRARLTQEVGEIRTGVNEVEQTVSRLRDQLRNLELETEAQILSRHQIEAEMDSEFDPLELDRYSTIQQLSRALAESVNDLISLQETLEHGARQSEAILVQQSRVNTELQDGLLQTRMVSFSTLAPRLRQVVRRASRETGKPANLELFIAEDGQLDRNVLEQISAPLEHMLRNAVVHGIESHSERKRQGKPAEGLVSIRVFREATELVIQVRDDGRGLNSKAILESAVERGLIEADAELTEQNVQDLIFIPGFSTAEGLSELAGRGIGMDVVRSTVRQIGGSLELSTEAGHSTEFIIRIPMTLTVMQALMVDIDDRQFAIPVGNILGVTKLPAAEYHEYFEQGVLPYAGADNPLMELETMLGYTPAPITKGLASVVVLEAGGQRAAIRIPELRRHQELVIKPLGPQLTSIPGILAGAISGEGHVILILDIGPLIRRATSADVSLPSLKELQQQESRRQPLVLVVDDSITVRKVTSRVLEQHQLEVMTARDGVDALDVMSDRIPDLILLDIEMPRMDGFELTRYVRADARLRHLPIIIISSRSGEKHRQTAMDVGASQFLGKPYQEKELLRHADLLLEESRLANQAAAEQAEQSETEQSQTGGTQTQRSDAQVSETNNQKEHTDTHDSDDQDSEPKAGSSGKAGKKNKKRASKRRRKHKKGSKS